MPKIRVLGSDYRAAFESAKSIISAGMLSEEMPECFTDNDGCIHNGTNVFEYIESDSYGSRSKESDFRIDEDGASWFSPFRKMADGIEDDSAASNAHLWEEFLADLSRKYHDKYFLVACKKSKVANAANSEAENEKIFELYKGYAHNIMNNFYPEISNWEFSQVFDDGAFDDIYGLSLRLQIGTGGEKEIPVLGTLYFKRHGNHRMIPLATDDAIRIEENIESIGDNDNYSSQLSADIDATNNSLNTLFSELTRIISEDRLGEHLVGCLHFDSTDKASLDSLLSRIQNDNKMLVCKQVEILGISHVNWEKYTFVITDKKTGRDMFGIVGGIDGKILMYCLGCDTNSDLILGNRISTVNSETNEIRAFSIDPSLEDLGLSKEDIQEIAQSRHFSSHYITVGKLCGTPRGGRPCTKVHCMCDLMRIETSNGVGEFCRDCPYPEVIYKDNEGALHYAPNMHFDAETIKLVTVDNIANKPCMCCGRYVSKLHADMYCKLCATATAPDGAAQRIGSENYEKYKTILPLHKRIASVSKQKLCFEDAELLVFVIGEKKYIFHKFWLDTNGYSKSPSEGQI